VAFCCPPSWCRAKMAAHPRNFARVCGSAPAK
jgi:hypothetical protein